MKKLFFIILLVTFTFAQSIMFTSKPSNHLREGAGSFYPLMDVIAANVKVEVLEKNARWIKVKLPDGRIGWISEQNLSSSPIQTTTNTNSNVPVKVSKVAITAAIKGFAQKFKAADLQNVDYLIEFPNTKFTPNEFNSFLVPFKYTKSNNVGELDLSDADFKIPTYDADLNELKIGYTVAARLASKGLVKDPQLTKYVNLIAAAIANKNEIYNYDFNVYILNDNSFNAFACPGGMIFITKGTLNLCSDEAEIAAVIAHEMIHIIQRHGLQEITQRKANIKSDEAFSELDDEFANEEMDEIDKQYAEVEADLLQIAEASYEKIVHKRLLAYELEADQGAAILIANAGYDPFAIARMAKKLAAQPKPKYDIFDTEYLAPDDAKTRAEKIEKFTNKEFSRKKPGATMPERFNYYMRKS